MKKLNILVILFIVIGTVLVIASCRKTKEEQANRNLQTLTDSIPIPP